MPLRLSFWFTCFATVYSLSVCAEERTMRQILTDNAPEPTLRQMLEKPLLFPLFQYYQSNHRSPKMSWVFHYQDGSTTNHSVEHSLVLSQVHRETTILKYIVHSDGLAEDEREVLNWAHQAGHRRQLKLAELEALTKLLNELPRSSADPPLLRTTIVSYQSDNEWRTEIYDSAELPAAVKGIIEVLGERFETRDNR